MMRISENLIMDFTSLKFLTFLNLLAMLEVRVARTPKAHSCNVLSIFCPAM